MAVQKLGDKKYRVTVRVFDAHTGKKKQVKRIVNGTKYEAEELERDLLSDKRFSIEYGHMPTKTYLEDIWLEAHKQNIQYSTFIYHQRAIQHISKYIGDIPLEKLNTYFIETALSHFKTRGTAKSVYVAIKAALTQAYRWGHISEDIASQISFKLPRQAKPKVVAYNTEELNIILSLFYNHKLEPLILVMMFGGLARSEVCGLNWEDIDLKTGLIAVNKTYTYIEGKAIYKETKNEYRDRQIVIKGYGLERLKELGTGKTGALCLVGNKRATADFCTKTFEKVIKKSEQVRYASFNNLRHAYATAALKAGIDLEDLSKSLGHAKLSTTLNYYIRGSAEAKAQNAAIVAESIKPR